MSENTKPQQDSTVGFRLRAVISILAERERELLQVKGPCSFKVALRPLRTLRRADRGRPVTAYLDRVRSLLAGITPGDWRHERAVMSDVVETTNRVHIASILSQYDAAFIAEAPTAVTRMLAQIDAVEALAKYLDGLAVGDRHYAGLIRSALTSEGEA